MKIKLYVFFGTLSILLSIQNCNRPNPKVKYYIELNSIGFDMNGIIPDSLSCKAGTKQKFPLLFWGYNYPDVKGLALIMDDPDAIPVAGYTWTHWVIYDIPNTVNKIGPGINKKSPLPAGAILGKTSFGDTAYGGPCPPAGQTHHYYFRLFALSKSNLGLGPGATAAQVRTAMQGNVIDSAILIGLFKQ